MNSQDAFLLRRVSVALFGLVLIGVPILAVGQEPTKPVVFEVAAVRQNESGQIAAQIDDAPGGRYIVTNAPLRTLILRAYQIPGGQLAGAPDWTGIERFDINAKLEGEPPPAKAGEPGERLLAMRSLLAERFRLVVHRESRQVPTYALLMARDDRKPGPMLRPSSIDCSPGGMQARTDAAQAGKLLSGVCGTRATTGRMQFGARTMSEFARTLSGAAEIGRNVIDRTGLTGAWDFDLTFTPNIPQQRPGQEPIAVDPNGPSLLTALQEQLGLRLESIRSPMEFLVIDRIDRLDREDAIAPNRVP